jgi:hypothetical protein
VTPAVETPAAPEEDSPAKDEFPDTGESRENAAHKECPVEEESMAPQEIASPAHSNIAPKVEEPSSSIEEVPSVALKEDLPSVRVEEPAIAEAVVEEKEVDSIIPAEVSESTSKEANPAEEEHEPPTVADAGAAAPIEEPRVEGDAAPEADGRELPTAVEQKPAATEEEFAVDRAELAGTTVKVENRFGNLVSGQAAAVGTVGAEVVFIAVVQLVGIRLSIEGSRLVMLVWLGGWGVTSVVVS